MSLLPSCAYAIIGGSATASTDFPRELDDPRVSVLQDGLRTTTPFGESPPLRLISVTRSDAEPRQALVAYMHGWGAEHRGRRETALALFWAFRKAGVRRIVAEAGSGSLIQNFRPRDLVLPHDIIDLTPQVGGRIDPSRRVVMRTPFCPEIREALWTRGGRWAAEKASRIFDRAVFFASEGPRFESAAEVAAWVRLGADITGQSISPEVYLAREIGACYAALTIVLNYAEGVRPRWDFDLLEEILRGDACSLGTLLIDALIDLPDEARCGCGGFLRTALASVGSDTA